ncbi:MAG: electron transfer flavoprotein alpha/ beta subunit [Chloroflexi bacterium]|nr:electron transfer flavoprotein alpha/ beta subunit [Chloroflexota bacterium]
MKIVVCVKQTPSAAETRFNEETKTLVREGVSLVISSLDRRALLEALRLRGEVGGTVTVVSMGPPQARSALQECLALGADDAVLLTDRALAGADTLATARALAAAIKKLAPDLVVCGKFSIDSETAQVPPEMAELLGLPQVTSARKVRPTSTPGALWVERETDEGYEQYEVSLPALLSVTELIIASRRPAPEAMEAAAQKGITVWNATDIGGTPALYGSAGSPTRVAELRSAALERKGRTVPGDNPAQAASQLADYLIANGLFQPRTARQATKARRSAGNRASSGVSVWAVAEVLEGRLRPVTHELLGAAQDIADRLGGKVAALLAGGPSVAQHVRELGAYGADTVYLAADPRLASYDTEAYTHLVASAIGRHRPHVVLFPATTNGRDLAPRVAARLQIGLTGDCVGVEVDGAGEVAMLKPAFGGNVVSPIYSRTTPVMATVRPGALDARAPNRRVQPQVVPIPFSWEGESRVRLVQAAAQEGLDATGLDDADVVIGVGMGVGGPENLPEVKKLAEVLHASLGSSLRVATAGWLPPQVQLGLTGRTVAPRFYIAIGVSGQANHLVGARKAEHIVAINNDPNAPIFKSADFGVVGDWKQVVPPLVAALAERRPARQD